MLDIGWTEIMFIMVLAVILIGPDEIPGLMVGLGRIVRRITYIKYAFSRQFEEFLEEADLKNIRNNVNFEVGNLKFDEAAEDEDFITQKSSPAVTDDEKKEDAA